MSIVNLNRVVVTGQLAADPELETLPSGLPVCTLRLQVHRRRQDPETGAWGERIVHLDVASFGNRAEIMARFLYVGRQVAVDGWLDVRAMDGDVSHVRIVAENVQFIGAPPDDVRASSETRDASVPALALAVS